MGKLKAAFGACVDELAGALEAAGFAKPKRPPFVVVQTADRYRCYRVGRRGPALVSEGDVAGLNAGSLRRVAGARPVELRLDSRSAVTRSLELPQASRGHADAIVRHQIERLTPWTAENAVYDYSQETTAEGGFAVRIVAAARERVDAVVQQLAEAGIRAVVVGVSDDPLERPSPIDLLHRSRIVRRKRLRRAAVCLLALFAVGLGASLGSGLHVWRLSAEAEALRTEIASARSRIQGLAAGDEGADTPRILAQKLAARPMVLVLDDLSAAVPQDTYLTEFAVDDRQVRLGGLSEDAPALVGILEETDLLGEVRFAATTSRDMASRRDRFEINALIAAPDEGEGHEN